MNNIILKNSEAEQYVCAARKNFLCGNALSNSDGKTVIVHFTDIHGDIKRYDNILELIGYIKPTFAVHTGDTAMWNTSNDCSFFASGARKSAFPVYNCPGNHDTFHDGGINTNLDLYEMFVSGQKNIICDKTPYYYVDFKHEKLRLLVLCPYDFEHENPSLRDKYAVLQQQTDWLVKTLEDAAENHFGVIIASHETADFVGGGANSFGFCQRFAPHPWGNPNIYPFVVEDIVDAFKNGGKAEKIYKYDGISLEVVVNHTFTQKGEFICYLTGHRHGDFCGYLPHHAGQLYLCMTCSGCYPYGYHNIGEEISDLPRIPGTVSEDAVNVYVVDRKNKTVSIARFGAHINDMFEKRIFTVMKY